MHWLYCSTCYLAKESIADVNIIIMCVCSGGVAIPRYPRWRSHMFHSQDIVTLLENKGLMDLGCNKSTIKKRQVY